MLESPIYIRLCRKLGYIFKYRLVSRSEYVLASPVGSASQKSEISYIHRINTVNIGEFTGFTLETRKFNLVGQSVVKSGIESWTKLES